MPNYSSVMTETLLLTLEKMLLRPLFKAWAAAKKDTQGYYSFKKK